MKSGRVRVESLDLGRTKGMSFLGMCCLGQKRTAVANALRHGHTTLV